MPTQYNFTLDSIRRLDSFASSDHDVIVRFRAAADGLPVLISVGVDSTGVSDDDIVGVARRELHRLLVRLEDASRPKQPEGLALADAG